MFEEEPHGEDRESNEVILDFENLKEEESKKVEWEKLMDMEETRAAAGRVSEQGGGESVEGDRGHFQCELLEFLYILFNMLFCKRGREKAEKNRGNSNSWSKM